MTSYKRQTSFKGEQILSGGSPMDEYTRASSVHVFIEFGPQQNILVQYRNKYQTARNWDQACFGFSCVSDKTICKNFT